MFGIKSLHRRSADGVKLAATDAGCDGRTGRSVIGSTVGLRCDCQRRLRDGAGDHRRIGNGVIVAAVAIVHDQTAGGQGLAAACVFGVKNLARRRGNGVKLAPADAGCCCRGCGAVIGSAVGLGGHRQRSLRDDAGAHWRVGNSVVVAPVAIIHDQTAGGQGLATSCMLGVKRLGRCGTDRIKLASTNDGCGSRVRGSVIRPAIGLSRHSQRCLRDGAGAHGHITDQVVIAAVTVVHHQAAGGQRFAGTCMFGVKSLGSRCTNGIELAATNSGCRRRNTGSVIGSAVRHSTDNQCSPRDISDIGRYSCWQHITIRWNSVAIDHRAKAAIENNRFTCAGMFVRQSCRGTGKAYR